MSGGTTAKPPSFHLQLRLIDANGDPFHHHDYVLTWGKDKRTGQTDANGFVVLKDSLDGDPAIRSGRLERAGIDVGAAELRPSRVTL
jgi:hypothetical protein